MRLVIVESPFSGPDRETVQRHIAYARGAVADCIARREAPIASHLLLTQPGVLDDAIPDEREIGIAAGLAWYSVADACIVYDDYGISSGMERGIARARKFRLPVIARKIMPQEMQADDLLKLHNPFGGQGTLVGPGAKTLEEVLTLGAAQEAARIAADLIREGVRRELAGDRRGGRPLVEYGDSLR